jgi:hypothetical protein
MTTSQLRGASGLLAAIALVPAVVVVVARRRAKRSPSLTAMEAAIATNEYHAARVTATDRAYEPLPTRPSPMVGETLPPREGEQPGDLISGTAITKSDDTEIGRRRLESYMRTVFHWLDFASVIAVDSRLGDWQAELRWSHDRSIALHVDQLTLDKIAGLS